MRKSKAAMDAMIIRCWSSDSERRKKGKKHDHRAGISGEQALASSGMLGTVLWDKGLDRSGAQGSWLIFKGRGD